MRSRVVGLFGICAACGLTVSLFAEESAESLLPKTLSRLKPVVVMVAAEVPLPAMELATVKQAAVIEAAQPQYPVTAAIATTPVIEAKAAPVVPSWALPRPVKKATSIPATNPYVVPRAVR